MGKVLPVFGCQDQEPGQLFFNFKLENWEIKEFNFVEVKKGEKTFYAVLKKGNLTFKAILSNTVVALVTNQTQEISYNNIDMAMMWELNPLELKSKVEGWIPHIMGFN